MLKIKSLWLGNDEFVWMTSLCLYEHASKLVYRWWNDKSSGSGMSPVAFWLQRGAEIVSHYLVWPKSYSSRNHQQLKQQTSRHCFWKHSAFRPIALRQTCWWPKQVSELTARHRLQRQQRTSQLNHRRKWNVQTIYIF